MPRPGVPGPEDPGPEVPVRAGGFQTESPQTGLGVRGSQTESNVNRSRSWTKVPSVMSSRHWLAKGYGCINKTKFGM